MTILSCLTESVVGAVDLTAVGEHACNGVRTKSATSARALQMAPMWLKDVWSPALFDRLRRIKSKLGSHL